MIIPWIMKITCGWNRRREAGRRQRRWSPTPLILIIMIVFIMMIIAITIMIHHHHHHDPNYHNCLHFNHHHHDPDYRPHSWFWFYWLSFFLISSWSWWGQCSPMGTPNSLSLIGASVSCQVHLWHENEDLSLWRLFWQLWWWYKYQRNLAPVMS